MRGYGKSDQPEAIDQYTIFHLVGDLVGLLGALEAPNAVIVGHDWGSIVAWHAALLRPDRFRAVVGLSVPFRPYAKARPTSTMPRTEDARFYQLYFQEPGVAEAELQLDPRLTIRAMLFGASGDAPRGDANAGPGIGMVPYGAGFLRGPAPPDVLPAWLTERDVDVYAGEFQRAGFRGALNWYRNVDRNWELMAPFADVPVTVPALHIVGDRDFVLGFPGMDRLLQRPDADSLEKCHPAPPEPAHARCCGRCADACRPVPAAIGTRRAPPVKWVSRGRTRVPASAGSARG